MKYSESIRIIAGTARGRFIKSFRDDLSVRPLLGRIKKSLFDILAPRLNGCTFLDLYSGTGAVGLEAISRGAAKAVFVDYDKKCIDLIKMNAEILGFTRQAAVQRGDIISGLRWLTDKFDIIYMGVPYKDAEKKPLNFTVPTIKNIMEADILKPAGIIISQRHDKEPMDLPEPLEVYRVEVYGDTIISFIRKK